MYINIFELNNVVLLFQVIIKKCNNEFYKTKNILAGKVKKITNDFGNFRYKAREKYVD